MTKKIIELREQLVQLSSDPIKTRELLDKLTEEEIDQSNIESPFHVGKKDVEEEFDGEIYKIYKTNKGYCIHYYGGYSVLVDGKLLSPANALQQIMDGVPDDASDEVNPVTGFSEKNGIELMLSAAEMMFRLPMFVFSNPATILNIAIIATQYMLYLQKTGEVPTEETDNPEYDKFILQMDELMENFAAGLKKEVLEYEKRNGINRDAK